MLNSFLSTLSATSAHRAPMTPAPSRPAAVTPRQTEDYRLPDGSIVSCDATATKGAPDIDFTLAGGRIVRAVRVQ